MKAHAFLKHFPPLTPPQKPHKCLKSKGIKKKKFFSNFFFVFCFRDIIVFHASNETFFSSFLVVVNPRPPPRLASKSFAPLNIFQYCHTLSRKNNFFYFLYYSFAASFSIFFQEQTHFFLFVKGFGSIHPSFEVSARLSNLFNFFL